MFSNAQTDIPQPRNCLFIEESQFNPSIPKRNCSLSLHCNALVLDILNPQKPVKKKSNRSEVCVLVIRSKETFVRCFYPRCGLDRTIVHGLLLGVIWKDDGRDLKRKPWVLTAEDWANWPCHRIPFLPTSHLQAITFGKLDKNGNTLRKGWSKFDVEI